MQLQRGPWNITTVSAMPQLTITQVMPVEPDLGLVGSLLTESEILTIFWLLARPKIAKNDLITA